MQWLNLCFWLTTKHCKSQDGKYLSPNRLLICFVKNYLFIKHVSCFVIVIVVGNMSSGNRNYSKLRINHAKKRFCRKDENCRKLIFIFSFMRFVYLRFCASFNFFGSIWFSCECAVFHWFVELYFPNDFCVSTIAIVCSC